jgi:acetylornithine/N-succinyldiaminopimelate aminotransferase
MVPGFSYAKFNDLASVEARWTAHTAAVMVEPVQGEGGVRVASRTFMQGLRRLCDERGALLIVDEVQSGIGRTGRFLATEHYGIEPDIVTLAKGLGGGVPIGATLAKESVAAAFTKGSHGTTFGGNPLAARAALTVLETLDREALTGNAARVGAYFLGRMRALARTQPRIREVRGLGLMVGVEVNGTADEATALMVKGVQNGLLFNTAGGNTLRFVPPLVATEADVDLAVAVLGVLFAMPA